MSPQTETKTGAGFKAGVKDYRLTYYTPEYQVALWITKVYYYLSLTESIIGLLSF